MLVTILTILTLVSATLAMLAATLKQRLTLYVFKPLTVILIILIALEPKHPTFLFYKQAVLAGLVFSLVGDIFLMLPGDRFLPGLVSFLCAHVLYIAAFLYQSGRALSVLDLIPFLIYGVLMLSLLWRRLGKMRAPVILYMLVILLMGWAAASRRLVTEQKGSLLAMLGAILFIISDSLLALDRFKRHFRGAQAFILGTYFAAQWLIALST